MTLARRVSNSSRLRIDPNSRATSASVSSVLVYSRSCSNSRAFSIATATCAPNCRSTASSTSVNCPFVSLSRLSAPITRPLRRSGTTSSAFDPGTASTYRESACTSLTSSGWPASTAAPTRPCPDLHAQRARDLGRIADRVRDGELVALGIEQVDGERLKVRDPRDELGDLLQQFFEVEDRRDLASERKERRQRLDGAGADVGFRCGGGLVHVRPMDVCKYNRLFTWT